jgi:exopolysaccharide biosynthesis polyprenyl glycosylphosphotransferase
LLAALRREEFLSSPARWWRDVRRRRMLAVADLMAGLLAAGVASEIVSAGGWAFLFVPAAVVLAKVFGLYERDQMEIRHLTIDELPQITGWAAVLTALIALLLPLTPSGPLQANEAVLLWLTVTVGAAVLRAAARTVWRMVTPPELTVVLGDGELGRSVRRKIELFGDMHLRLLEPAEELRLQVNGNGDDSDPDSTNGRVESLKALGGHVDRIIIASESIEPAWIGEVAALCREQQVKLSVVSPLRGRAGAVPRLSEVADLPVLEYDTRDISRSTRMLKRAFDLLVAVPLLIVFAPLLPLIALAIRLDSSGPVLFIQTRAGFQGRPFRMFKFRTMHEGADALLASLIEMQTLKEQPAFKFQRDPRVTRVGRLLRRCSLDELPQLVNVIRGEMSIVGPRPEQIDLVRLYRPEHRFRLSVKPGLTGPMQVFGRGALTFSERLAVELDYVENLSLSRDLRMLAQTLPAVVRGTGAY